MPCTRAHVKPPALEAPLRDLKTKADLGPASMGDETPTIVFNDTDHCEKVPQPRRAVAQHHEVSEIFDDESEIKASESEGELKKWPAHNHQENPIVEIWHQGQRFGFRTKRGELSLTEAEGCEKLQIA